MRRVDREVSDYAEILVIIKACDVMRLAMVDETGQAYIVPLNFGWESEGEVLTLFFHCAKEGRKLDILRQNPQVCFEMDTDHCLTTAEEACGYSFGFKSVIGWGEVELLESYDTKVLGLQAIMRHAGRTHSDFSPEATQRVLVGRVRVDKITGKSHA
jgi:nitroimidazol reductase NimA-like FMN-containing flavoprotein (pyridoxamine 5'-phosphate oxidase superfamily)